MYGAMLEAYYIQADATVVALKRQYHLSLRHHRHNLTIECLPGIHFDKLYRILGSTCSEQ